MENKIYNEKSDIDKNKVLMVLDEIIYPKSFKEIINSIDFKKKEFEYQLFLKDSYVWVMTFHDTNQKRLDETTEIIVSEHMKDINSVGLFMEFNGPKFIEDLKNIKEKINNGISERIFHNWFIKLAFHLSQNKHPLDSQGNIQNKYLPGTKVISVKHSLDYGNVYSNYIFFSSDGTLIKEPYFSELLKKVEKKVENKFLNMGVSKKPFKRNPLDSKLRHEVFKRDNYTCLECGATNKEKMLHCDHIVSVAQGGTDEMNNLQTLCVDCNLAKSDKSWIGNMNKIKEGEDGKDYA